MVKKKVQVSQMHLMSDAVERNWMSSLPGKIQTNVECQWNIGDT